MYILKKNVRLTYEIQKDHQKHKIVRNISENHRTIPFEYGFLFIKRNLQMKFKCPDTGTVRKLDDILYIIPAIHEGRVLNYFSQYLQRC